MALEKQIENQFISYLSENLKYVYREDIHDRGTPSVLRFPEFQNDGEWEVKRLGEIADVVNDKCNIDLLDIETYISTENMLQNYEGVKRATKLPSSGTFTSFKLGDVLFSNIRPYLKKVWQARFDGAASNDIIVFRAKKGFDKDFVAQIIKSDSFIAHSMAGAKGVKMPRGDKNMMLDYSVFIPQFSEQRRIAQALSSIDDLLHSTEEKLELLKAHKKGLMQQLFVSSIVVVGGGKLLKINYLQIPKLRFPEFYNEKGWEEKKLG
ncbi:MAG: restriction endonuclease subunit S [Bacteroidales bacterium]|nr:restriction endonuclease subunit S [Bacteroidales bacterium]